MICNLIDIDIISLADGSMIGAVTGPTRNKSGHWRSHCYQTEMTAYNLVLTPGYYQSTCDCQICSVLWDQNGPFVALTKDLQMNLDATLFLGQDQEFLVFMDFFLSMREKGKLVVVCPDLMYYTGQNQLAPTQADWMSLAKKWSLQGISFDLGPTKILKFDCHHIDIKCDPQEQTKSLLVPWCCMEAAYHIIKTMNLIHENIGVHYELDSGSLLGAVKLNNFIPWDIDGDIYIKTEDMPHFHQGGKGRSILESKGISIANWNEDNYWDKGAGNKLLYV